MYFCPIHSRLPESARIRFYLQNNTNFAKTTNNSMRCDFDANCACSNISSEFDAAFRVIFRCNTTKYHLPFLLDKFIWKCKQKAWHNFSWINEIMCWFACQCVEWQVDVAINQFFGKSQQCTWIVYSSNANALFWDNLGDTFRWSTQRSLSLELADEIEMVRPRDYCRSLNPFRDDWAW